MSEVHKMTMVDEARTEHARMTNAVHLLVREQAQLLRDKMIKPYGSPYGAMVEKVVIGTIRDALDDEMVRYYGQEEVLQEKPSD
jgi:hypothetical protein